MHFNSALSVQRPDLMDALYEYNPTGIRLAADQIFPILNVPEQRGEVEVVTRESLLTPTEAKRSKGGNYNEINETLEPKQYSCQDYGLVIVDKYGHRETVQYNRERGKVEHVTFKLMLERERRAFAAIMDTSVWTGSALQSDAGTDWVTIATADPVADVVAAKKKVRDATGVNPNALILSALNLDYLLTNAKIREQIQGSAIPTQAVIFEQLAGLMGLEKIIVSDAVYNTSAEGKTATLSSVASDTYVSVARVGIADNPAAPSVGFTPNWTEDSGMPYIVESYYNDDARAMKYRARHNVDEWVVEPYLAHLIKVSGT